MTMRTRGFTLIELAVAIFITAVLVAIGYGTVQQAVNNREVLEERQERLQPHVAERHEAVARVRCALDVEATERRAEVRLRDHGDGAARRLLVEVERAAAGVNADAVRVAGDPAHRRPLENLCAGINSRAKDARTRAVRIELRVAPRPNRTRPRDAGRISQLAGAQPVGLESSAPAKIALATKALRALHIRREIDRIPFGETAAHTQAFQQRDELTNGLAAELPDAAALPGAVPLRQFHQLEVWFLKQERGACRGASTADGGSFEHRCRDTGRRERLRAHRADDPLSRTRFRPDCA